MLAAVFSLLFSGFQTSKIVAGPFKEKLYYGKAIGTACAYFDLSEKETSAYSYSLGGEKTFIPFKQIQCIKDFVCFYISKAFNYCTGKLQDANGFKSDT